MIDVSSPAPRATKRRARAIRCGILALVVLLHAGALLLAPRPLADGVDVTAPPATGPSQVVGLVSAAPAPVSAPPAPIATRARARPDPPRAPVHTPARRSPLSIPPLALSPPGGGPAQAPAVAFAASSNAAGPDYARQVLERLKAFRRYPEEAEAKRAQGVVRIVFQVDRAGDLLGVWLSRSSGSASLDREAADTVRRAAPFPAVPADLPSPLPMDVPIEFLLRP